MFQAINREGRTVIVVTHDAEIANYAERILRFRDGRLISDQAVARRPRPRSAGADVTGGGMKVQDCFVSAVEFSARQSAAQHSYHAWDHHRRGRGDRHGVDQLRRAEGDRRRDPGPRHRHPHCPAGFRSTMAACRSGTGAKQTLSEGDAASIAVEVPGVRDTSPVVSGGRAARSSATSIGRRT